MFLGWNTGDTWGQQRKIVPRCNLLLGIKKIKISRTICIYAESTLFELVYSCRAAEVGWIKNNSLWFTPIYQNFKRKNSIKKYKFYQLSQPPSTWMAHCLSPTGLCHRQKNQGLDEEQDRVSGEPSGVIVPAGGEELTSSMPPTPGTPGSCHRSRSRRPE